LKSYSRISEVQADLSTGHITCVDLVRGYLENIREHASLNAFLEIWEDEALNRAAEIDLKIQAGTSGKLAGIVIALKDNLSYKGHKLSASSKILSDFESLYTATSVQRLWDEDAIFIGRTNCDEFAMGASNENSAYGPVKNPFDNSRVPGGSSGGSAVAVAAEMCHCSLGSDTGGSIRQPAAFNGLYGLKPTYGRISRWGLLAYASSFDQIGPFAKSLEDVALLTQIMSGKDAFDATAIQEDTLSDWIPKEKNNQKFAVLKQAVEHPGLDSDVKAQFEQLIVRLQNEGHQIEWIDFPLLDQLVPVYYVLTTAEASSNLSRYSGMLYGYRSPNANDLESTFVLSRSEGFGPEVKRRIMLGTFVLSSDQYDAYYEQALKVRRIIQQLTDEILSRNDAMLLPTTSTPAFKIGEKSKDPVSMYLADLFTVQANITGNPAISIPLGKSSLGLPIGVQLMTQRKAEHDLYDLAQLIERVNS